jgi:hypothetical protein
MMLTGLLVLGSFDIEANVERGRGDQVAARANEETDARSIMGGAVVEPIPPPPHVLERHLPTLVTLHGP